MDIYYFPEKYKIIKEQEKKINIDNIKLLEPQFRTCVICNDNDGIQYLKYDDKSLLYRNNNLQLSCDSLVAPKSKLDLALQQYFADTLKYITTGYTRCEDSICEYGYYNQNKFNCYNQIPETQICTNCFMQRCFCFQNHDDKRCIRCNSNKWMSYRELNKLIIENQQYETFTKKNYIIEYSDYKNLYKCDQCNINTPIQYCHLCDNKLCENCRMEIYIPDTNNIIKFYRFKHNSEKMYICKTCHKNESYNFY